MKQDCCNMKVTEIKDGYRIEITGKDIKGKGKEMITNCCTDEKCCDEMPENCCPEEKKRSHYQNVGDTKIPRIFLFLI